ncbi:MAG: hypothetical protein R3F50_04370 [Gammaproteobacteria bacterium]|jgi:hypothetical protein
MFTNKLTRLLTGLCLALCASLLTAQELQLDLLSNGALIIGVVSQADGSPAANLPVRVALATQPENTIATLQTDPVGIFTFTGNYDTSYRATVGSTTAEVALGAAPPQPLTWPPIYVTLGILLLLSLIPARMLRRKDLPS